MTRVLIAEARGALVDNGASGAIIPVEGRGTPAIMIGGAEALGYVVARPDGVITAAGARDNPVIVITGLIRGGVSKGAEGEGPTVATLDGVTIVVVAAVKVGDVVVDVVHVEVGVVSGLCVTVASIVIDA